MLETSNQRIARLAIDYYRGLERNMASEHTVRVVMVKGAQVIEFTIHPEEMRIVEQLLDRLKVYSIEPIDIRYF